MNKLFSDFLQKRKISQAVIEDFNIHSGENLQLGECIVIPIADADGNVIFNKYRRNPLDERKPKYVYDKGSSMHLFGWHKAKAEPTILVTEGEMDCLVAWSANVPAVSSTGGAMSFDPEWGKLFLGKEVILCFDNDDAGGMGMMRALKVIPHAKVLFLPDRPGIKDISDYVAGGGDLHALLKTAKFLHSLETVQENRAERASVWQNTFFHDAYIKEHTKEVKPGKKRADVSDKILRAKAYPIDEMHEFKQNKASCLWHSEKTASMTYFPRDNKVYCFGCGAKADAIDMYRRLNNCSFNEAVAFLSE